MRKAASAAFVMLCVTLAAFVLNNQVHAPKYQQHTIKTARMVQWPYMALSATGYTAAGAGTAADNGAFAPAGNDNSAHTYYTLANGRVLFFCGQGSQFSPPNYVWCLMNTTAKPTAGSAASAATDYYVIGTSDPTNFPLTGWVAVSGAANPPTFTVSPTAAPTVAPVLSVALSGSNNQLIPVNYAAPPAGATFLDIFRSTTTGTEGNTPYVSASVTAGTAGVYNDTNVNANTSYFYNAKFRNAGGSGPLSNEGTATTGPYPTQNVAKGSTSNVMNSNAAAVQSTSNNGFYTFLTSGSDPGNAATFTPYGSADANGFTLTSPASGTVIYALGTGTNPVVGSTYAVRWVFNGFITAGNNYVVPAAQIVAPTVAPTLVAQSGQGGNAITYSAAPAGATVLYLYRGTATGQEAAQPFSYTYPQTGQGGTIIDTNANTGTASFYTAKWGNTSGNGPASNEVSAVGSPGSSQGVQSAYSNIVTGTPNAVINAPTQLTLAVGDSTALLNWVNPANLSAIAVLRRVSVTSGPVNPWLQIGRLPAVTAGNPATVPTTYTDTTCVDGVTYDWTVFAYA